MWAAGISGDSMYVAIIDDGVQWSNPDIEDNFVCITLFTRSQSKCILSVPFPSAGNVVMI